MADGDRPTGAEYRFRVAVRLRPDDGRLEPDRFETVAAIPAVTPPDPGWLLFRDRLWRGEVGDERTCRRFLSDRLGLEVVAVEFAELRTDETYYATLREAIATDLDRFNATTVEEVIHKYLGSSVHLR